LLNVFLIVLVCFNIRFGTIVPNLIFIFKHTKTIKNTFNNMILSNSLCVFQDTLDGKGLMGAPVNIWRCTLRSRFIR